MRIFLYCIDALEYDFIKDRDYPFLKQSHYHKVEIPDSCLTVLDDGTMKPFTPVIWKCILTGRNESDSPTTKPERYQNSTMNWFLRRKIVQVTWRAILGTGIIRRGFPERAGFKRKDIIEGADSILSAVDSAYVQTNPVLAEVKWAGVGQKLEPYEILGKYEDIFEEEKKEALEKINEPWDIYLFYTKILDVAGHLFWGRDDKSEKYYEKVNEFSSTLKSVLPDDVVFVVLSDHGMMGIEGSRIGGDHSFHAYASFSHAVETPDPVTILDIRWILEDLMGSNG